MTRRGYSLIELLVVIAIIAVLFGMLLPSVLRAAGKSQGTVCISNMRQIHEALMMYAADHDDQFPWWWRKQLTAERKYVSDPRIWVCPLDPVQGEHPSIFPPDEYPNSYYYLQIFPPGVMPDGLWNTHNFKSKFEYFYRVWRPQNLDVPILADNSNHRVPGVRPWRMLGLYLDGHVKTFSFQPLPLGETGWPWVGPWTEPGIE